MKIDEILTKEIRHELFGKKNPELTEVVDPLSSVYKKEDLKFQQEVLNYFFKNKNTCGIDKIYQLKNSMVDGVLELKNGKIILLEIKYRLNWVNCCQARLQFQRFSIEKLYDKLSIKKPESALIVFNRFSGDWDKIRSKNRKRLDGWNRFYEEENILSGSLIKTHILQLTDDGHLSGYPENVA